MQLIELPEEILIMIVQELDFCSLQNLYNTCKLTRNIISMQRVIKKCDLSCSVMATVKILREPFFIGISEYLNELKLPGVTDLCKTIFLPTVKKLKYLKTLDISYTSINVLDLIEIYKECPTIKNLTINFQFGKVTVLSNEVLLQCQAIFEHFVNVNFVGSLYNLLHSKLGLYLLSKSSLDNLTYTLSEKTCRIIPKYEELILSVKIPHFKRFIIYFLDWKYKRNELCYTYSSLLAMLYAELNNYEYIIMLLERFDKQIYATQAFKNFFEEKFNINASSHRIDAIKHVDNMAYMFWHKNLVTFDDNFYNNLTKHLGKYFPHYFDVHSNFHALPALNNCEWYYTYPTPYAINEHRFILRGITKRRVGAPNFTLNYDAIFENKCLIDLSLHFKHPLNSTITLSSESNYLGKLRYLNLLGLTRYDSNFFKILFQCCISLETINIESSPIAPCASAISRSLHLSKSLKNIRLVEKNIDFKKIFLSFSQCQTLENIHIADISLYESTDVGDPTIVLEKCSRLYSIYLELIINKLAYTKILRQLKKAKEVFHRPYLNITLTVPPVNRYLYNYDPFVDVFKLNPLKPI